MRKMNAKQRAFCLHYLRTLNATKAALLAGYSKRTARTQGSFLLTKVDIKKNIDENRNNYESVLGLSIMTQLNELKKLAYSNFASTRDGWFTLKEFEELPEDIKGAIEVIDTQVENQTRDDGQTDVEVVHVKIKFHSKTKALDMINKMLGLYTPEKMEIKTIEGLDLEGLPLEKQRQIFDILNAPNGPTDENNN